MDSNSNKKKPLFFLPTVGVLAAFVPHTTQAQQYVLARPAAHKVSVVAPEFLRPHPNLPVSGSNTSVNYTVTSTCQHSE